MYAVIETGGKQVRVSPGTIFDAELLAAAPGETIEIGRVLLISDDNNITLGNPAIEGAKVIATAVGDIRAKKVIVFKYKAKTRYRRKKGHRQDYTRLEVKEIVAPGISKPAPKPKRHKAEANKEEATQNGS
ncbi:MAG: 50S ribosomal protein L21 [Chloroflexi bacterium]|nr:50S ribosomal protein L21 [Chloroflexota bacterium]